METQAHSSQSRTSPRMKHGRVRPPDVTQTPALAPLSARTFLNRNKMTGAAAFTEAPAEQRDDI